jgi:integrase
VVEFYEEREYETLVASSEQSDPRTHVTVLLGSDAGLRLGEMLALEWADPDFARELIKVQRELYESDEMVVTIPKGGKPRIVPMTARLRPRESSAPAGRQGAVRRRRQPDGQAVAKVAARRRGAPGWAPQGRARPHLASHLLLAPRGAERADAVHQGACRAPVAGDDATYRHLSSAAPREAIAALDQQRGDVVETETTADRKCSGIA